MILSYIRKNQCKRLFYPLMLLGVVIFLVWRSPVTEYVTKRTISNAVLINDSMAKKVLAEAVIFISSVLWLAIQLPKHLKDRLL